MLCIIIRKKTKSHFTILLLSIACVITITFTFKIIAEKQTHIKESLSIHDKIERTINQTEIGKYINNLTAHVDNLNFNLSNIPISQNKTALTPIIAPRVPANSNKSISLKNLQKRINLQTSPKVTGEDPYKVRVKNQTTINFLRDMALLSSKAYCLAADNYFHHQFLTAGVDEQVIPEKPNVHQVVVYINAKLGNQARTRQRLNRLKQYPDSNADARAQVDSDWYTLFKYEEYGLISMAEKKMVKHNIIYEVIYTGHALGGVMAIFAALAFHSKFPNVMTNVVTFGSLRPGNQIFADHVSTTFPKLYRVVNFNDWSPHMPPVDESFRHPSTEYWISRIGDCNCTDELDIPLYKCFPKKWQMHGKYINENPDCHFSTIPENSNFSIDSHQAPYFGVHMGLLPEYKDYPSAKATDTGGLKFYALLVLRAFLKFNTFEFLHKRSSRHESSTVFEVHDIETLNFLKKMAIYAREAYCIPPKGPFTFIPIRADSKVTIILPGVHQIVVYILGDEEKSKSYSWPLKSSLTPYPNINVGMVDSIWLNFYLQYEKFLIELAENKMKNLEGVFQIIYTGHDLGGVYAMYAALAFKRKHPLIFTNVVTFGSPRPGDEVFAKHVNTIFPNLYRVTNMGDWAPQTPNIKYKYRHPHTEYWISSQKNDCDCPNTFGSVVYKCLPTLHYINRLETTDENMYCLTKTEFSDELENRRHHIGPYFGLKMFCTGSSDSMLQSLS
ncbi:hypothetical protein G9A89_020126 [Geosiphon pyriformis]|nr:hypothetical protein G9A89_020126 [Geosiphon pyriformis]